MVRSMVWLEEEHGIFARSFPSTFQFGDIAMAGGLSFLGTPPLCGGFVGVEGRIIYLVLLLWYYEEVLYYLLYLPYLLDYYSKVQFLWVV